MDDALLTYSTAKPPATARVAVIILWIAAIVTLLHVGLSAWSAYEANAEMRWRGARIYGVTITGFYLHISREEFLLIVLGMLSLVTASAVLEAIIAFKHGRVHLSIYVICWILALVQMFLLLNDTFGGIGKHVLEQFRSYGDVKARYVVTAGATIARLGLMLTLLVMLPILAMRVRRERAR